MRIDTDMDGCESKNHLEESDSECGRDSEKYNQFFYGFI